MADAAKMSDDQAKGLGCLVLLAIIGVIWFASWWRGDPQFTPISGSNAYAMVMPERPDPEVIEQAARDKCSGQGFCKVLGWTDGNQAAKALPMLQREVDTLAFSYALNRDTGFEQILWDCARFPKIARGRCLVR